MMVMAALILISTTLLSTLCSGQNYYNNPNWIYEAKATFHRYAKGHVTVINGRVMIDLDITNVSSYQGDEIPSNCFSNGAYIHIHDDWNNNQQYDYMTEDNCDEDQTGDHFDPWFACSRVSGENSCAENGGCIRKSSFISDEAGGLYRCDMSGYPYEEYPYACEVGDMGKHESMVGVSGNKISETYSSLWEMNGLDFGQDFSVVLHCSNDRKTPVLCAPFNVTNRTKQNSDPSHLKNADAKMSINFDGLSVGGRSYDNIMIEQGEGWIRYKLPKIVSTNCTMWSAYIMDKWNHTSNIGAAKYDDECSSMYVGGVYDPTYSCINEEESGFLDSGSYYCNGDTRCGDNNGGGNAQDVNYACDNYENALGCAAGHMTGRTGYINMTNLKHYDMTFDDRVSPPLHDLVGKSVLLYCEQPTTNVMPMKICKQISNAAVTLSSSQDEEVGFTAGGAIAIVIIILLVIGIGSAWRYGKKHPKEDNNTTDNKFAALGDKSPLPTPVVDTNSDNNTYANAGNGAAAPLKPPPAPLVTQVDNDTRGAAFSVAADTEPKESMALPATEVTNNTSPVGTMNEGGGYLNNEDQDDEIALPPPIDNEEVVVEDIENQDEEYAYYEDE